MPTPDDISAQIAAQIATAILKTPKQPPAVDGALISSGLIDSFHLVDLALFVEDTFGVRLDDGELNAQCFDSVAQLTALIVQRQKG